MRASAWPATTAAAASPIGWRSIIPARVERMATLDIVPTYDMWHGMDRNMAMKVWHWPFLAQPAPLPEMLIEKAPVEYLEWKLASWTKAKNLSAFDRARSITTARRFPIRCASTPIARTTAPGLRRRSCQ